MRTTLDDTLFARQVSSLHELVQALRLVHDNYVRCGYMAPEPSGMRVGPRYALPSTRAYVAAQRNRVVATMTLFADSPLGLPLDDLYPDVSGELRAADRTIMEVGMLADRRRELTRGIDLLMGMMKLVFHDCRAVQADDLLITVNPRHAKFYSRLLYFEQLGEQRCYASVGGAPAVLLRLPVSEIAPKDVPNRRIREFFFSPVEEEAVPDRYVVCREDLEELFVRHSDVLLNLTPAQAEAIEACYPGLVIADLLAAGHAA